MTRPEENDASMKVKITGIQSKIIFCAGSGGAGLKDGRIRHREDITDGFENAPAAFMGLLQGKNFGKALVRVSD